MSKGIHTRERASVSGEPSSAKVKLEKYLSESIDCNLQFWSDRQKTIMSYSNPCGDGSHIGPCLKGM